MAFVVSSAGGCNRGSASPRAGADGVASEIASMHPAPRAGAASESSFSIGEADADLAHVIRIDPPAAAGDLEAEIDRFTTIDACVDERANVDPLLGDALEAIGYDTFLRDACRVIDATKAKDANRCSGIDASLLAGRCRAMVAEVSRRPDACPWEAPSKPARGREAKCVAMASRDPRLCAAAGDPLERATCEATLARDDRFCTPLRDLSERARCARDANRWRGLMANGESASAGAGATSTKPFVVTGRLRLVGTDGATIDGPGQGASIDLDLSPDLTRGVTVVQQRDGARIIVGPLSETGLDFIAPSPHTRPSFAVQVFVPLAAPTSAGSLAATRQALGTGARIERAEVLAPGRTPLATPGARSTLVAKVETGGDSRGDTIKIEVNGDLGVAARTWHLHAEATTFVRDVVRSTDLFNDERPPEGSGALGGSAGMR